MCLFPVPVEQLLKGLFVIVGDQVEQNFVTISAQVSHVMTMLPNDSVKVNTIAIPFSFKNFSVFV